MVNKGSSRRLLHTRKALYIEDAVRCSPWSKTRMTCHHRRQCISATRALCPILAMKALKNTIMKLLNHLVLHPGLGSSHVVSATTLHPKVTSPMTTHHDNLGSADTRILVCRHSRQAAQYPSRISWCHLRYDRRPCGKKHQHCHPVSSPGSIQPDKRSKRCHMRRLQHMRLRHGSVTILSQPNIGPLPSTRRLCNLKNWSITQPIKTTITIRMIHRSSRARDRLRHTILLISSSHVLPALV